MAEKLSNILVLGASGDQGIPLVARLQGAGFAVTAGVRRADALSTTPFPELSTVLADITDTESLAKAFEGQDALVMHLPFEFDRAKAAAMGQTIADAASVSGLRKIVFNTSCFIADHDLDLSAHDGRRDIEKALEATGIPCVFIEPMVFMDNIIRIWSKPSIVQNGIFAYPAAETLKVNFICLDDVAQFMVAALQTDTADGKHVAVGGPDALTGHEMAEKISAAAGKSVRFESLPPAEFAARMSELVTGSREVVPLSIYDGMAQFYSWYNAQTQSPLTVNPEETARLLKIATTSADVWAARQDWTQIT
jgi:uncharacterized protein YbjT (DUF2867 family)